MELAIFKAFVLVIYEEYLEKLVYHVTNNCIDNSLGGTELCAKVLFLTTAVNALILLKV